MHSGYPGGLKERTAIDQWDRDPTKILKDAVKGMLPKNKMQVHRMEKLKIFPEAEHPFTDFNLVSHACLDDDRSLNKMMRKQQCMKF